MTSASKSEPDVATSDQTNGVPAALLALLVCPVDHSRLDLTAAGLTCATCQRTYPVVNGIPNFVIDE